jgi:hypothetical protein
MRPCYWSEPTDLRAMPVACQAVPNAVGWLGLHVVSSTCFTDFSLKSDATFFAALRVRPSPDPTTDVCSMGNNLYNQPTPWQFLLRNLYSPFMEPLGSLQVYKVCKSPSAVRLLSQMNPILSIILFFFSKHFNIPPSSPTFSEWYLSFWLPKRNFVCIYHFAMRSTCPALIAVRRDGEINGNITNHSRMQTYHLMSKPVLEINI